MPEKKNKIKKNVRTFLEKFSINNTNVLIAFSGGFDSMCLLHILNQLKDDYKLNLTAIHLNHNWRAEESFLEANNCTNFCKELNINFYQEILPDNIKKTETYARKARYEFFENCAKKFKSNVIFTAHNADDNAETLIYRISKGTGIDGLSCIAENRDIYYRPLLKTYRKEIELYCNEHYLSPNSDSSNGNTKYKRNHIRKNIIPELEKISIHAKSAINKLAELACNDTQIINEYLSTLKDKFKTQNFINYSKPVQQRIIYQFLTENNFEYDKNTIEKIIIFIKENSTTKNGKTLSITTNQWLFVNKKEIKLIQKDTKECTYKITIEPCNKKPTKFPPDNKGYAFVDLSTIGTDFEIRKRQNGDIIQPLGTNGKQKLKKYLSEKGIPKDERDNMLLLCKGNEIFWVPKIGLNDKIKVKTIPTHKLKLEKINEH